MGIENSWSEDEEVTVNFPIPLPMLPVNTVEVDTSVDNGPFSEDLECLFSPVDQSIDTQEDDTLLEGGVGEAGVCGLRNLGNTCFMSAGVQCLVATPPLVVALLNTTRQHQPLTLDLVELTRKMWSGQFASLHPSQFKNSLAINFPSFNDYRQHDCQEFLALLLDTLHEQMNTASSKDFTCQVEPRELKPTSTKEASTSQMGSLASTTSKKWNAGDSASVGQSSLKRQHKELPLGGGSKVQSNVVRGAEEVLNNNAREVSTRSHGIPILNNAVARHSGLDDIIKDARTSKVNVLITKQEANNEIKFDSDKYPRVDNIRRNENFNYNSFHDNITGSGKRCKLTMTEYTGNNSELKEGLDLKRVKLDCSDDEEGCCGGHSKPEKNKIMELERRQKGFDSNLLEKNCRMEYERKLQLQENTEKEEAVEDEEELIMSDNRTREDTVEERGSEVDEVREAELLESGGNGGGVLEAEEQVEGGGAECKEGEKHWVQHLAANRSVIVTTFQGQFKSTVVCSVCNYVSVTYEPFMYLSVPLPNALKKQICVTFVGDGGRRVTELLVEVNRHESVATIRSRVAETLTPSSSSHSLILMAEVLNHHITKILDDSQLVRDVNMSSRSLYAFQVVNLCEEISETKEDKENERRTVADSCCTICLEDKEVTMRQHKDCTCILCDVCVTASCQHYKRGGTLECPVCRKEVHPDKDLTPLQPPSQVSARLINMPVVLRVDKVGDGNNNQKSVSLFGHPVLVRLPNRWTAEALRSAVESLLRPYSHPYRILLVDGQGTQCSRCMYHSHCRGCEVAMHGAITLYSSDTLAITFSALPQMVTAKAQTHPSMSALRPHQPLSLYDCIHAFSQSEQLDEQNPWYCPRCKKNQCATKTLTIWRYPDYLIVYLKRFIFHDRMSTKLEEKVMFPLCGLNLAPNTSVYDLYACVCHIGGVSAGHYTTYTQHPNTNEWHYYNDSYVSKQAPQEEDYSNAYILFYRKRGLKMPTIEVDEDSTFPQTN